MKCKLFNKVCKSVIELESGYTVKIHSEIPNIKVSNLADYRLENEDNYKRSDFICLKSYDNVVIFVPQKVFNEKGYNIFGDFTSIDPSDGNHLIHLSKIIDEYSVYRNIMTKSSDTIVPTFIDINKIYVCNIKSTIILISLTEHLQKSDDIYNDLSQLRQIKERLHI